MRKLTVPSAIAAAFAAMALSASAALAARRPDTTVGTEAITRGMIASWNPSEHLLRLANGSEYYIPSNVARDSDFMRGQEVKISYEVLGFDQNVVHSVTPVEK